MSYTYRDRDRDWDEPRSSASVKRYVIPPEDERDLVVRRPADWDDHSGAVSRYGRDMDYDSRHHERGSYEREYSEPYGGYHRYARPEQTPIPIIISNGQPIIIYEARGAVYPRDSDYDFADRDPGYYYHRRVREYDDDRDRHLRREVSPADSISQAGRGRRHRDRDYSSDDSMVYVRRGSREREGREEHPHHQRHMAEGALVGVGAAELIRNRRKNTGDEVSDGVGRVGQDVGAGALGAVAVEAASRARDYYRSRSRPRAHSRSHDDDDRSSRGSHHHRHYSHRRHRRSHGHRSRSRARSHSRTKTLAGLGIGAAAIAAGVALANKNHGKSYDERRSRSRHRRHRSSRRSASEDGEADGHHRGESQRRKHMAGAGLAGAAAAGLIDRARSHSRSHKDGRSRSRSKIRQALPIVAGGLGAAGATGLYEKNKEKKDEERSRHRERRHRSRSLSRTPSDVYPDPTRDSNNLIEYGDRPVHGSIPAADYYGRSPTPPGYFSDATDPVASDAAGYGSSRRRDRSRNRSRSRPGTSSDSSSDSDRGSRRRRRSRHGKSKKVAGAALASAGVGYAAHKYSQHKDRRSPGADRDKLRFEDEVHDDPYESHDPYDDQYNYMPYPPTPPPASRPIENHPPGPGFPPPPGSNPRYAGSHPRPYPPAEYGPPPGSVPPQSHGYPPPPAPEPYPPRSREANANVSTGGNPHLPKAQYTHDGLKEMYSPPETPRVRRRSQPFASRDHRQMDPGYEPDDSDSTIDSANRKHRPTPHRRRRSYPDYKNPDRHYNNARPSEAPDDAPPSDSDSTIDLPDRFDSHGRLLPEKESGSKSRLEDLLGGGINSVFA